MSGEAFLDTNVLVYAYDARDRSKQSAARALIARGGWVVSAQVLGEFLVTVTRKLATPLPLADARSVVVAATARPVVPIDAALVLHALAIQDRHGLSYWDALIVAAASRAGCARLWSEDLQDGGVVAGVEIQNPFRT